MHLNWQSSDFYLIVVLPRRSSVTSCKLAWGIGWLSGPLQCCDPDMDPIQGLVTHFSSPSGLQLWPWASYLPYLIWCHLQTYHHISLPSVFWVNSLRERAFFCIALREAPDWSILEGCFVRWLRSFLLYQRWPLGIKYPVVYSVDRDLCCNSVLSSSSYTILGERRLWKERLFRGCRYSEIYEEKIFTPTLQCKTFLDSITIFSLKKSWITYWEVSLCCLLI